MELVIPEINWLSLAPELVIFATAILLLLMGTACPRANLGGAAAGVSLAGIGTAFWVNASLWGRSESAFSNMLALDNFGLFFNMVFLFTAALTVLASIGYWKKAPGRAAYIEYYALLLFSLVGMMFMAAGTDLIVIFLGLETMSISIYVLAGFSKQSRRANEAALKYLLLGAFGDGFLLYGIALLFGATGSTNLAAIFKYLAAAPNVHYPMLLIGLALLLVGFGFKVALAPFHMWTPDVYEGAPTAVTGFMAAGVKAAAFAAFMRVFLSALPTLQPNWSLALWVLAVATMTLGNLAALRQENIKRMLAYSSIAHAGYILVGMVAAEPTAADPAAAGILYYLLAYAFMNLGAFVVVILYGRRAEDSLNISDYAGMGFKYPLLGAAMAVFMFSLAGIPPTAGFVGKFYIFGAAIKNGFLGLAVIGVLNSVLSVYYYLRVTIMIYMRDPDAEAEPLRFSLSGVIAALIAALATLLLGLFPNNIMALARDSVALFLG